jgi:hypothetical protein
VHLALGGFATVIAMGVGGQMVPTFLMVRASYVWAGRLAWRATAAGALLVATGALLDVAVVRALGAASFAVGVTAWLGFVAACFVRRGRRPLDNPVALLATAHILLAAALVAGLSLLFVNNARVATAYIACGLVGWLTLFMIGAQSRIVPMILRTRPGSAARPQVKPPRSVKVIATTAVAALIIAAVSLPAGVLTGSRAAVQGAAFVQAFAVVLLLAQHAVLAVSGIAGRARPSRLTSRLTPGGDDP